MKNIKYAILTLFVLIGSGASARSIMPAPVGSLEDVNVISINQFLNLMPPVPLGLRPTTTIKVGVMSNGCTDEKSFRVKTLSAGDEQFVAIERIRPDHCRGIQRRIELDLTTQQLKAKKSVKVVNPELVKLDVAH